jgi:hypothetical protein
MIRRFAAMRALATFALALCIATGLATSAPADPRKTFPCGKETCDTASNETCCSANGSPWGCCHITGCPMWCKALEGPGIVQAACDVKTSRPCARTEVCCATKDTGGKMAACVDASQRNQRCADFAPAAQDLVNEDWDLPSGGSPHTFSFALSESAPVEIDVIPVKDAGKGFTLRLVPVDDFDACSGGAQGRCRSRPGFDGFKVASFSHTEPVPPGRWTFYVANTENIFKSATVHVHVVVNP